jgi:hypothetical protein
MNNMTNTQSHAQRELDILIKTTPDAIIRDFVPEILALCEAFGNSGQSGGSAPYTASALSQAIKKLCLQQTIAPLTGEDDEWMEVTGASDLPSMCQNKREGAVFKDGSQAYYLDAITWKTQTGATWSGNAHAGTEKISSRQNIKSFPFYPKTFVVDVIEKEVSKDNWEFDVKNHDDLKEVFEYYDKRSVTP